MGMPGGYGISSPAQTMPSASLQFDAPAFYRYACLHKDVKRVVTGDLRIFFLCLYPLASRAEV